MNNAAMVKYDPGRLIRSAMIHDGYHFWGMHMIWWFFWIILIFGFWGFFEPVPKKKIQRDSPLEILKRRFAGGDITKEEYEEKRRILEEGN